MTLAKTVYLARIQGTDNE